MGDRIEETISQSKETVSDRIEEAVSYNSDMVKSGMTAKQYLSEIKTMNKRLRQARATASDFHLDYNSLHGIDYSKDKVQTSPVNAMEEAAWRMIERRRAAQLEVEELEHEIRLRTDQIRELPDRYADILYAHYVLYVDLREYAYAHNVRTKSARNTHALALRAFAARWGDFLKNSD